jgi:protein STU2
MKVIVDEEPVVVDAFDLAEPVDIRKNLPSEFNEWIVSSKWKERKDALEALLTNSKVPRIKEENYTEIMGTLGRCMKDANIVVVTVAAQCVEAIARGLRKPFTQYRQLVMTPMVEKLKERKASVVEALSNAMDGVFAAVLSFRTLLMTGWIDGCTRRNPRRNET